MNQQDEILQCGNPLSFRLTKKIGTWDINQEIWDAVRIENGKEIKIVCLFFYNEPEIFYEYEDRMNFRPPEPPSTKHWQAHDFYGIQKMHGTNDGRHFLELAYLDNEYSFPLTQDEKKTSGLAETGSAEAACQNNEGNDRKEYEYREYDGKITIHRYIGTGGEVVIPSEIDGKPVESICGAFCGCRNLTSVTIPEGCETITSAFCGCTHLSSVVIPGSVKEFCGNPFSGCSKLEKIELAGNSEYNKSIDGVIFSKDGKTLHSYPGGRAGAYTIPKGCTEVDLEAFSGSANLTSITIPEGVTKIGGRAFRGCRSLISITIPEGCTKIEDGTFLGCRSLTSVKLPHGCEEIGFWAFSECVNLTSIEIPKSVTCIERGAFEGRNKLVIHGAVNSYAKKYAKKKHIPFRIYPMHFEFSLHWLFALLKNLLP